MWMKSIELRNGLKLDIYDISRKLSGDRWYVAFIGQVDVQLTETLLKNQPNLNYSIDQIRHDIGETVCFKQKRERFFIDEREKDALLNSMIDSFIKKTSDYFLM